MCATPRIDLLNLRQSKLVVKADNQVESRRIDAGAVFTVPLIKQIFEGEGESVVLGHLKTATQVKRYPARRTLTNRCAVGIKLDLTCITSGSRNPWVSNIAPI